MMTVFTNHPIINYTRCNRIRYTTLKIYCDQTNSNITTQFLTEHLLTLQIFLEVLNMAATGYAADIHTIFNCIIHTAPLSASRTKLQVDSIMPMCIPKMGHFNETMYEYHSTMKMTAF
jgi:hypothetical protein